MNKLNRYIDLLKRYFNPFISISIGTFLFILFFQPFPLEIFEFNDLLIFVAGFGVITFISLSVVKVVSYIFFKEIEASENPSILPSILSTSGIFIITSIAFAFYLRFVGQTGISFHIMAKIMLICLAGSIILRVYETIRTLHQHNDSLIRERKMIQKQVEKYEEDYLNKSIVFTSDTNSNSLDFLVADVAYIRSADNYVEVVYREGDSFKKKLLRNTLRSIELQIKDYSNFVRCHRTCIVNSHFIENIHKNYDSYSLSVKGFNEKIPVSRQYLLKIREIV